VGGVKEKLLAARRMGLSTVVIPRANESDLELLPRSLLRTLRIHLVADMEEVLTLVLDAPPAKRHTRRRAPPVAKDDRRGSHRKK
jgi:ATP-dependent Lon protease